MYNLTLFIRESLLCLLRWGWRRFMTEWARLRTVFKCALNDSFILNWHRTFSAKDIHGLRLTALQQHFLCRRSNNTLASAPKLNHQRFPQPSHKGNADVSELTNIYVVKFTIHWRYCVGNECVQVRLMFRLYASKVVVYFALCSIDFDYLASTMWRFGGYI